MTEPVLKVLSFGAYKNALQRTYPKETVWYWKMFGDVAMPRAFITPDNSAIYVCREWQHNVKLIAHEYGHYLGYHHPSKPLEGVIHAIKNGFAISSFTGLLRWRDPEGLIRLTKLYMERQGL